jgi:excisionase family DNA binding protein
MASGQVPATVWLTTQELAERLKVPVSTLHQWRHKGYGPRAARIGRFLRYRLVEVERWEREREAHGGTR